VSKATIAAQLQHTTQSTASAGVFVDKNEKKKNKVTIKKVKQPLSGPGSDERRAQKDVVDRVLAKAAAPALVIEKAVDRHRKQEKQKQAMNPTKNFGKGKKNRSANGK
jgi:hypothetical protein